MIANVWGASKFWYLAQVLILPDWVKNEFEPLIFRFIWKNKIKHVSQEKCCKSIEAGGLGIVNFESKCKSLRVRNLMRLFEPND